MGTTRTRLGSLALVALLTGCRPPATPPHPDVPNAPVFRDITRDAGLTFRQFHGGCGKRYFVEQVAAGAAFLDADGDGHLDIYFPQPTPLGDCTFDQPLQQRLYRGDGTGRFRWDRDAFGGAQTDYGISAAVGDYDNDGDHDLYICCYGRNTLYRNRGDGRFEDVTAHSETGLSGFSTGAVWFDADGDGWLDLYVLRYCEWSVARDIPCPGPHGEPGVCQPTTYTAARNVLYRNNRDGTFTDTTAHAAVATEVRRSLGVAAADFDGDRHLDLFVANDLGPNALFHGRGDGTFEDIGMITGVAFGITGATQANMGVAVGDYDEDGDPDVLVTTFQNEPKTLYRNEGAYFTDLSGPSQIAAQTTRTLGFGVGFLDAQNRGRLDLFIANGHVSPLARLADGSPNSRQPNQFLRNDGAGRFTLVPAALPADDVRVHRGACFGDVDEDGRTDILVSANDDRPTLLHNESLAGNWLDLRFLDRHGCATPIGTRVTARFSGQSRMRSLVGGGSYGGDSEMGLHFGLGEAAKVDRLEIRWLSGQTQVLENVAINRRLLVREPAPGGRANDAPSRGRGG